MLYLVFLKAIVLFGIVCTQDDTTESNFNSSSDPMRIYYGHIIKIENLPYIVAITDRTTKGGCSGGLIHIEWVLTAGHCVGNESLSTNIEIYAGMDSLRAGRHFQKRYAKLISRHPNYKHHYSTFDIGLLQTNKPFKFNPGVQIVPVSREPWSASEMYTRKCVAAGWGGMSNKKSTDRLRMAYVTARHGPKGCYCQGVERNKQFICLEKKARICHGDSGGLLVCNGKAVGVASGMYMKEHCGKTHLKKKEIICSGSISLYIYICPMLDWLYRHPVPNIPQPMRECRARSRRSSGKLVAGVSDEWDSAAIHSSCLLLIVAVQFFLYKII